MSANTRIDAPRVERKLNNHYWNQVLSLSEALEDIGQYFVPPNHDHYDLSILSAREVALSYRHAPDNSLIKTLDSGVYSDRIANDMLSKPLFAAAIRVNVENISFIEEYGNTFAALELADDILISERRCAINSLKRLTGHELPVGTPKIVLGKIDDRAPKERYLHIAQSIFQSGEFDLSQIELNRGEVYVGHSMPIFKSKKAS